jgi:hypothetical protein
MTLVQPPGFHSGLNRSKIANMILPEDLENVMTYLITENFLMKRRTVLGGAKAVPTVDELEPKDQNQDSPHQNVNCLNTMH